MESSLPNNMPGTIQLSVIDVQRKAGSLLEYLYRGSAACHGHANPN